MGPWTLLLSTTTGLKQLMFALLLLVGCCHAHSTSTTLLQGATAEVGPFTTVTVQGRAIHIETKEPLSGTTVTLLRIAPNAVPPFYLEPRLSAIETLATTTTTSGGDLILPFVPRQKHEQTHYLVEAQTSAGLIGLGSVKFRDGLQPVTSITLELRRQVTIRGQVVDDNSNPVSDARLKLFRKSKLDFDPIAEIGETTRTASDGSFVFPSCLAGLEHSLLAEADGYTPRMTLLGTTQTSARIQLLPGGAHLAGTLWDFETKEPVPTTTLTLTMDVGGEKGAPALPPIHTQTDAEGRYELRGLAPGIYQARVSLLGKFLMPGRGALQSLSAYSSGISVLADTTSNSADLFVFGGYSLEGVVVDETGKPIEGVELNCSAFSQQLDPTNPEYAITGPDGKFSLRTGVYSAYPSPNGPMAALKVRKLGYVIKPQTESALQATLDIFTVTINGDVVRQPQLRLQMEASPVVTGRVVSESGLPMAGVAPAAVGIGSSANPFHFKPVETGPDGLYTINVKRNAVVQVEVKDSKLGYGLSEQATIRDTVTTLSDIVLKPNGSVAGTVVDQQGNPIPSALVWGEYTVWGGSGGIPQSVDQKPVETDFDGKFVLPGVPPLTDVQVYGGAAGYGKSERSTIRLNPGETKQGLRLSLPSAYFLSGMVLTSDRMPLPQVSVAAMARNGAVQYDSETNMNGHFRIPLQSVGPFQVIASLPNGLQQSVSNIPENTSNLEIQFTNLTLSQWKESRKHVLIGEVVDRANGKPVEEFRVSFPDSPAAGKVTKRADKPGHFRIEFDSNNSVQLLIEAEGYVPLTTSDIRLKPSPQLSHEQFILDKSYPLQGRVITTAGEPVSDAQVRLCVKPQYGWPKSTGPAVAETKTGSDGRFELPHGPQGWQFIEIIPLPPLAPDILRVEVPKVEGTRDVGDLKLESGGTIRVQVINESTGRPAESIGLICETNAENKKVQYYHILKTDSKGEAVFTGLRSGGYRVCLQIPQNDHYGTRIQVEPGQSVDLTLRTGQGRVQGRVVPSSLAGNYTVLCQRIDLPGGNYILQAQSEARFSINELPPGLYDFAVQTSGSDGKVVRVRRQIRTGENPEVLLDLGGSSVKGQVLSGSGEPVPNALIQISETSPDNQSPEVNWLRGTSAGPDGKFAFPAVPPGAYRITAQGSNGETGSYGPFQLSEGAPGISDIIVTVRKHTGSVEIIALDIATGMPIKSPYARLHGAGGDIGGGDSSGREEVWRKENVPPGRYTARVYASGFSMGTVEVDVQEGQTAKAEVVLSAAGDLKWYLITQNMPQLDGIRLTLEPKDPSSLAEPKSGKPDFQGYWHSGSLVPGDYTGKVTRSGAPDILVPISIKAKQTTRIWTDLDKK